MCVTSVITLTHHRSHVILFSTFPRPRPVSETISWLRRCPDTMTWIPRYPEVFGSSVIKAALQKPGWTSQRVESPPQYSDYQSLYRCRKVKNNSTVCVYGMLVMSGLWIIGSGMSNRGAFMITAAAAALMYKSTLSRWNNDPIQGWDLGMKSWLSYFHWRQCGANSCVGCASVGQKGYDKGTKAEWVLNRFSVNWFNPSTDQLSH